MKKALVSILLVSFVATTAFAARLFDYRGVFPTDRAADAKITNYMLLKKDSLISFQIEEQGRGISERIRINRIKLTSDEKIFVEKAEGIKGLQVPETGIYEISLVPATSEPGEIRFILNVIENEGQVPPQDISIMPPPPAIVTPIPADAPVASAAPAAPVEQAIIAPAIASPAAISEPAPILSQLPPLAIASDASAVIPASLPAAIAPEAASASLTTVGSATVVGSEPMLLAPRKGYFLNPLNGFRFSVDDVNFISAEKQAQMFRVFLRAADGSEQLVKGSFFSPEPDTLSFLPEKIIPGAVYNIEIADESLTTKKLFSVPAFPELAIDFSRIGNDLKARISWPQSIDLLPNPSGQMIALSGCVIVVKKGNTPLFQLDPGENLAPFGAMDRFSYRAQPYELEVTVPVDILDKDICEVEIKAAVDGSQAMVQARRATWQASAEPEETADNDEEDLSAVPAAVADEASASAALAKAEEIIPLESMAEKTAFQVESSFSVLENETDSLVSWPHDLLWDDKGGLWVLDSQRRRVCNFNRDGTLVTAFGSKGEADGTLGLPVAMAIKDQTLYVADTTRHCIHLFNTDGTWKSAIKANPAAGLQIDLPGGICFRKNEMWVSDRGLARILCFNEQGAFLGSFGSTPAAPIIAPINVRADSDSLFILEKNGLVKKFSPMGHFDATFQTGCVEGLGFDVDPWGGIWVCDAEKFQVLRFARNGSLLTTIKAPPAPKPWLPTAVSVRKDGKIAVTDAQNKMLHIFAPAQ